MKRTTLILDPGLYAALRRRATDEGRTLTDVVEEVLRRGLQAEAGARRARVALPSYDLGPFLTDPSERGSWPDGPETDRRRPRRPEARES